MSFNIKKLLDIIILSLDRIIKMLDIAINAFYKFLDYLIKTFEVVSKKILNLLANLLKLLFYILPFIFMIIIGPIKNWNWMTYTGGTILVLIAVLFFRDFIAEIRGDNKNENQNIPTHSGKAFVFILILNLLFISYSISFFLLKISPEKYISSLFFQQSINKKADSIREAEYLNILSTKGKYNYSTVINAINNLGKLHSTISSPVLIERLKEYISKELDTTEIKEVKALIKALKNIGGSEVCNILVQFEVHCQNVELKKMSSEAANEICGIKK